MLTSFKIEKVSGIGARQRIDFAPLTLLLVACARRVAPRSRALRCHMPTLAFRGPVVECEEGERVRDVLLPSKLTPHSGERASSTAGGLGPVAPARCGSRAA